MSEIILGKYHGVGNDYLIFDPKKNDVVLNERLIRQLCRRNIGAVSYTHLDVYKRQREYHCRLSVMEEHPYRFCWLRWGWHFLYRGELN